MSDSDRLVRMQDEIDRLKDVIDTLHNERSRLMWRVNLYWSALEPVVAVGLIPPPSADGMPRVADVSECVEAVRASQEIMRMGVRT